jgi:hypothetical protein
MKKTEDDRHVAIKRITGLTYSLAIAYTQAGEEDARMMDDYKRRLDAEEAQRAQNLRYHSPQCPYLYYYTVFIIIYY